MVRGLKSNQTRVKKKGSYKIQLKFILNKLEFSLTILTSLKKLKILAELFIGHSIVLVHSWSHA